MTNRLLVGKLSLGIPLTPVMVVRRVLCAAAACRRLIVMFFRNMHSVVIKTLLTGCLLRSRCCQELYEFCFALRCVRVGMSLAPLLQSSVRLKIIVKQLVAKIVDGTPYDFEKV